MRQHYILNENESFIHSMNEESTTYYTSNAMEVPELSQDSDYLEEFRTRFAFIQKT